MRYLITIIIVLIICMAEFRDDYEPMTIKHNCQIECSESEIFKP